MAAKIVVLYEITDASIVEELPLDEEDGEFHLISAAAAFHEERSEENCSFL